MSSTKRRVSGLAVVLTAAVCCAGAAGLWGADKTAQFRPPEEDARAVSLTPNASKANLLKTYVELQSRIAERLSEEKLAERCKAFKKELNQLILEDEIDQIQKQLSELRRKNLEDKGAATRLQRAIDALRETDKETAGGREL